MPVALAYIVLALLLVVVALEVIALARSGNSRLLAQLAALFKEEGRLLREENDSAARRGREEVTTAIAQLDGRLQTQLDSLRAGHADAGAKLRSEVTANLNEIRATLDQRLQRLQAEIATSLNLIADRGAAAQDSLRKTVEQKLEALRGGVETKLETIRQDNAARLEQMRATVEEKLQGTLEARLGESFRQVSRQLEVVHQGLGEMRQLAEGVGDLKRVMSNVKARGTWGEVQLGALLEEMLAPSQFQRNVSLGPRGGQVEYAVRLPGRGESDAPVWLPLDSKFPVEDYRRLSEALDRNDAAAADAAAKALETRVAECAKTICEKYIHPPQTTDFAILFLPSEGLFAEIIRKPDLPEMVQRKFHVMIAGPATLSALLLSLQAGFRSLAVQQRSAEVWKILGAVKTQFSEFGNLLDGVKRKLEQAGNKIDDAARQSRKISRALSEVESLPAAEAAPLLDEGDAPRALAAAAGDAAE